MRLSSFLFSLALFTLPWVGVGTLELLGLDGVGGGLQPSMLLAWVALLAAVAAERGALARRVPASLWAACGFTVLSVAHTWTLSDMGLFGEEPWSKSAKQAVMLLMYVGVALAPAAILCQSDRDRSLWQWERWLSLGLLFVSAFGLLQALDYYAPLPGIERVDKWFSSNPSIAAGSHELYLGHRFVGIPRIRATACEPLYFGSYLLIALPICALGVRHSVGRARAWRVVTLVAGATNLVLTFSRGVYAAAAAGVLAAAIIWWRAGRPALCGRRALLSMVGVAAMVVVLVSMLSGTAPWALPGLLSRRALQTFADHDMSNLTRFYSWGVAWEAFLSRPVLGHGWGSYGFLYYPLAPESGAAAHFGWPVVNNVALRVLAEAGAVGLALWAWVLAGPIRSLGQALGGRSVASRALLFSLLLLTLFVQSLSHSQLQLPHLWVCAGGAVFFAHRPGAVV